MTQAQEAENLQRSIGRIEGKLESLVEALSRADASRSKMYEKIEAVDGKITSALNSVDDLDIRITKIEPVISDVSKWRERAIGARMTVTIFVASVGGGVVFALQWLYTHLVGKSS